MVGIRKRSSKVRVTGLVLCFWGAVSCGGRTSIDFGSDSQSAAPGDGGGGGDGDATGGSSPGTGGRGSGGGGPEVCEDDGDCLATDACQVARCSSGTCEYTLRDQDGDGFFDALCGGTDCNDLNALASPGHVEDCTDGSDNDCNGVTDCFDPVCRTGVACGCSPAPSGESCTNGADDDCDGAVDCLDPDCVGTISCGCETEVCENGGDDDCDNLIDCADDDCFAHPSCVCQATVEQCTNGSDEDCDGLIDCADPDCGFNGACLCLVPTEEDCTDARDNDCDGLIDCGDPVCFSSPACQVCVTEVCSGGVDEDCDGFIDCADPSCAFDPACPPMPEQCSNDRDDDLDGLADCNDPDCQNTQICIERQNTCATARRIEPLASATYSGNTTGQLSNFHGSCGGDAGEAVFRLELNEPVSLHVDTVGSDFDTVMYVRRGSCVAGAEVGCDDDSGGQAWSSALDFSLLEPGSYFIYVDGLTVDPVGGPNEGQYVLNVEVAPAEELCADGFDNDGDGYADCADTDCEDDVSCENCEWGPQNAPPVAEYGVELCTDGFDNDCDGLSDCEDEDCSAAPDNPTECCNGLDDNGNGIADDFNCRCVSDADCDGGQLCYTSTVSSCGIPCETFFGDVCPFLAPGSSCNVATSQCEY